MKLAIEDMMTGYNTVVKDKGRNDVVVAWRAGPYYLHIGNCHKSGDEDCVLQDLYSFLAAGYGTVEHCKGNRGLRVDGIEGKLLIEWRAGPYFLGWFDSYLS